MASAGHPFMTDADRPEEADENTTPPDNIGHIIEQPVEQELHTSYLTYAMSTIMCSMVK